MAKNNGSADKLGMWAIVLMIFTSVFGSGNSMRGFYLMGYSAIPWYLLCGIMFFVPYAFMVSEYGAAFSDAKGGIYSWMEASVGPKYAFIGTFIWFTSYMLWMVQGGSSIGISFSTIIFGRDTTGDWQLGPLNGPKLLGIFGVCFVAITVFIGSRGLDKIKKVAAVGGTVVLARQIITLVGALIIWASNGFKLMWPIDGLQAFTTPLHQNYQNPVAMMSFAVYALFAYGGLEAIGGLADKAENPKVTFPKAIMLSCIAIVIGYSLLIFVCGMYIDWNAVLGDPEKVHMANFSIFMNTAWGTELATVFGATPEQATIFSQWLIRIFAIFGFLSYMGAWFTLMYSPLKQLIEGTPKELWPGKMGEIRESDGMPVEGMKIEVIVVCILILAIALGGDAMAQFYNVLLIMLNIGMTLPYLFVAAAFPKFKKLNIERPYVAFKSNTMVWVGTIAACAILVFGNAFAIFSPILEGDGYTTFWSLFGPIFFGGTAFWLYSRYEKKVAAGLVPEADAHMERPGSNPELDELRKEEAEEK